MNRLEKHHIDFLRTCAAKPNSIHALPLDVLHIDADAMAAEGLLVKYQKPTGRFYAIARYGAQYVKEISEPGPELTDLAVKYVMSKGFEEDKAKEIVEQHGVNNVLQSQADEMRQGAQREVTIPTNAQGVPEIKYKG
jgi:hypothetical protein